MCFLGRNALDDGTRYGICDHGRNGVRSRFGAVEPSQNGRLDAARANAAPPSGQARLW
jgi:hypothetical protein